MKKLLPLCVPLIVMSAIGCAHHTSMSDPHLRDFYRGRPLEPEAVKKASDTYPNDVTLIELQAAFALLREGDMTAEARSQAKRYLEKAAASFEDLKEPNNFSTAFTADAKTPYRGRPYERVLASMFLGILDMADGRCDMAIPAFKSAEFLDARWQPFQFGSDAPLVYALSLRCLKQNMSSPSDLERAKEGLFRSLRMLETLDDIRNSLEKQSKTIAFNDPSSQISFMILDAGISSALMESGMNATAQEILDRVVSDALRFYVQVLANKDDTMHDTLLVMAKNLESEIGATAKVPSAQGLSRLEATLKKLVAKANSNAQLTATIEKKIASARRKAQEIYAATSKPKTILLFEGTGPKVISEGEYREIASVLPGNTKDARPSAEYRSLEMSDSCGLHKLSNGSLSIVLCDERSMHEQAKQIDSYPSQWQSVKLWSSSYQATSMVGRRFDKILRGRAQFRLGADSAAAIGAATAAALLEAGNNYERDCRYYGRNCEAAQNLQLAGALAGIFAGASWLAGRAVNPEADTRYLPGAFESGYLLLKRED